LLTGVDAREHVTTRDSANAEKAKKAAEACGPKPAEATAASARKLRAKAAGKSKEPEDSEPDSPEKPPKKKRQSRKKGLAQSIKTMIQIPGVDATNDPDSRTESLHSWRAYITEHCINRDEMLHYTRKIFNILEGNSVQQAPPELVARDRLDCT
ncbi:hypothetical protein KCU65_g8199, partial [Aureobasidium melanogenum]